MTFDTFTYAEGLKNSGMAEEHVRALTQELTKALKSEDLATKQDLAELKTDIIKWLAAQMGIMATIIIAAIKLL